MWPPYIHQSTCFELADGGKNVILCTGTSSGKTLAYLLPTFQRLLAEPAARALFLYPTKALARDQLSKVESLVPWESLRTAVYDGDTPKSQRSAIRKTASIVISNPDMLHHAILPSNELWTPFLKSVRVIVIDEIHSYRGVFGAHVAGLMRRLLRLCEWHHSHPIIIASSATIGNPEELFQKLTGKTAEPITDDGSETGKRTFVIWDPPMLENGSQLSPNIAVSQMNVSLLQAGLKTMVFNRARVTAELVLRYCRDRIKESGGEPAWMESYRAGYTAKERRAIEANLFSGKIRSLSATTAMELGVDVGGLDSVILNGYPGTRSSFWQQAGRAGRGGRDGLAILVAHADPMDQYFARHPSELYDAIIEKVPVEPNNPYVLQAQLKCAAHERPLLPSEVENFGASALAVAEEMDAAGELSYQAGRFFYPGFEAPQGRVSLRGGSGEEVHLYVGEEELGTMERSRAIRCAHEGAIYLHRGTSYLGKSLDLVRNIANFEPTEVDYYTTPIVQSTVTAKAELTSQEFSFGKIALCAVEAAENMEGFRMKSLDGNRELGTVPLELPLETFQTVAVRVDLPFPEAYDEDSERVVHTLEHALLAIAPLIASCDRSDLGTSWYAVFYDTMRPAVFLFDRFTGGIGLAEELYRNRRKWLQTALNLLTDCDCPNGCPSCLYLTSCELANEGLDKPAASLLLRRLTEAMESSSES